MYLHFDIGETICYRRQNSQANTVRITTTALENGVMSQLSGNQIKLIIALALKASKLTQGSLYDHLHHLGLVDESDLGALICHRSQSDLGDDCGINAQTVGQNLQALETQGLLERRMKRIRGRYTKPLFILALDHCSNDPYGNAVTEKPGHGVSVVVESTGLEQPAQPNQQPTTKQPHDFSETANRVFQAFAAARGTAYTPTARDEKRLRHLLDDGYPPDQIIKIIQEAVAATIATGTQPRHFGYCVPIIREQPVIGLTAPASAHIATTPSSAPPLPNEIRDDVLKLGWIGSRDEVRRHYAADPGRVEAWIDHFLDLDDPRVKNIPGLFRASLRSGEPAPTPKRREDRDTEARRYIEEAYDRIVQR